MEPTDDGVKDFQPRGFIDQVTIVQLFFELTSSIAFMYDILREKGNPS